MDLEKSIMSLADARGVSGDETNAAELALSMLKDYTDDCFIKNGNVIGHFGCKGAKPHILIDAHIDQIGFTVTHITDDGFLKISGCGGIDRRLLLAQPVTVLAKKSLDGVICAIPPHLETDESKVPEMEDICVDVGLTKVSAEEFISLGDKIVFASHCAKLQGDRITGAALDDRCGVASILRALELVKNKPLHSEITVMFSTQEEVGERGAKIGAFDIEPDIAIAVDVSFALTSGDSEVKCGAMGRGCMIGFSPVLDRELSQTFKAMAENRGLPYQIEVMSGTTGTNADRFSVNKHGVKVVTLSIPLKYMHTPVEVISLSDVENTAQLIAAYITEVSA
ncbi:MAG: M42 family metallopeptidase [Oscillospiraceae bacterium]|jgi:endoglucanase|nr:M42 family metallopeptidase [Oscillospiraceae bacterium]